MDEGWSRWLMEAYDFGFSSLRNPDVLAGDLRSRYDVVVIAGRRSADEFQGEYVPPSAERLW